nr:hypothetical protein [Gammaproteobacteria bacterium]
VKPRYDSEAIKPRYDSEAIKPRYDSEAIKPRYDSEAVKPRYDSEAVKRRCDTVIPWRRPRDLDIIKYVMNCVTWIPGQVRNDKAIVTIQPSLFLVKRHLIPARNYYLCSASPL